MTKDELRALLSVLVPAAEARGDMYKFVRVGSGKAAMPVSLKPNASEQPQVRPVRPRRMYQRQGVHGAGFMVETYKTFQDT